MNFDIYVEILKFIDHLLYSYKSLLKGITKLEVSLYIRNKMYTS